MIKTLARLRRLPIDLKVAFSAALLLLLLNLMWAANQASWKLDSGTATLFGAIIGFAIVGRQAKRGFANLVRSQAHQSKLDREAREHADQLENAATERADAREKHLLLSAIRAEIVAVYSKTSQDIQLTRTFAEMTAFLHRSGASSNATSYKMKNPDAPIFRANIPKIGLLGTDLGADVIKVLSLADGQSYSADFEKPLTQHFLYALQAARYSHLAKWNSDLFHVAMRIRAIEEGKPDLGSLISTEQERHKQIEDLPGL